MASTGLDEAIDRLYGVPMEDFVGERARLAKELKGSGDRETADEVAKLPKPTAAAWALNHVAREDPEAVAEWLDAAEDLREASLNAAEVGGDALRGAMAAHRAATTGLTGVVRDRARPGGKPLSGAMVERVRALLQSATADPEEAERLRAGRLTEDKSPVPAPPPRPRPRPAGAKPTATKRAPRAPERDRKAEARAARQAELERLVSAAEKEAKRLRGESDHRTGAADAAGERLEEARRALNRTESEAAAAKDAAKDAEKAAASAEQDLRRLRARLRDA